MLREIMQNLEMNQLYLVMTALFSLIVGTNAFSYKNVKDWGQEYPECNGKHQSPVTIRKERNKDFPHIKKSLKLTDFHKLPKKLTIENTGHTVEIKAEWSGNPPMCTGGPLSGNYVFEKITFRWAPKPWLENEDPETAAMYYTYDMEMLAFFYKTDFKSFKKAETQKGGLAVISKGFLSGFANPHHLLDNLEKNLHKVQYPNSTAEIPPFALTSRLCDGQPSAYLFYGGSLDYPPCSESVTWFFDYNAYVPTDGLLSGFRKIKLDKGDVSNVRPVQKLNKRRIQWTTYLAIN